MVVLSNFLLQFLQLKHDLCHLAPAPTTSSAMYTVFPHRGHFEGILIYEGR